MTKTDHLSDKGTERLDLGDQFDAFFPAQIARVLSGRGVVPVLVRAEAGQRATAIGIVDRARRGLGRLRRFVEVVVRVPRTSWRGARS